MMPARGIRAPALVIARRRRLHESPVTRDVRRWTFASDAQFSSLPDLNDDVLVVDGFSKA